MKRILSLILCVLMLIPCLAAIVSAAEINDEYRNFAIDEGMGSYASSIWNQDSDPKYINNGVLEDSYRVWRPQGVDRNPALDDRVQYCGLRSSSKYYEVQNITIYLDIDDPVKNNIRYTIRALVLGEWKVIGEGYNSQSTPVAGDRETLGKLEIDVEDVVTREIRIECSEWGRHSLYNKDVLGLSPDLLPDDPETPDVDESKLPTSWHDWWKVPIVHEVQTWGCEAPPPPWDVPFGAVLSTNACLGGMADATSTNTFMNIYAALATDDKIAPDTITPKPYWQAGKKGSGQAVWTIFDRPYDIDNVTANFGGSIDGMTMKYDVQILLEDGTWEYIAQGLEVSTSVDMQENITVAEFATPKRAAGVKFIFTEVTGGQSQAILTEMGAEINSNYKVFDEDRNEMVDANKCVFLRDYMTANRKQSTAVGNLAIFGSAYASSVMTYANISAVDYLNDGGVAKNEDFAWFANTFVKGTYCGIVLKEAYKVDKLVLYFNDPVIDNYVYGNTSFSGGNGSNVMEFDVQVKVDGEFKTIKSGLTSYDKTNHEYIVSVQFDEPVLTDDVRVVYTSNGMVFPYMKEFEVYSSEFTYRAYLGYQIGTRTNGGKVGNAIDDFAAKSLIPRSSYLDKISPIQYFEILKNFDIKALAWI